MDTPASGIQPSDLSQSVLKFPQDHYRHLFSPTEWWWHTGTLHAADGRVFGFEINAACFFPMGFLEVMLSDVANNKHYQQTAIQKFMWNWAEADPTKDWWVKVNQSGGPSFVTMNAPQTNPTDMTVKASITDEETGKSLLFDLSMRQNGPPLIVWGTGVAPFPPKPGGVLANNYYYSLTRIETSGTVLLDGEVLELSGTTWMDHEWGHFGTAAEPILWFLQDMQLDNGVHISHYASFAQGKAPKAGERVQSNATVQFPDGTEYFLQDCWMTPSDPWITPSGTNFFMQFKVEIPAFDAVLTVSSLINQQDFPMPGVDVYEGVARAEGTFQGQQVSGTAWNEQKP